MPNVGAAGSGRVVGVQRRELVGPSVVQAVGAWSDDQTNKAHREAGCVRSGPHQDETLRPGRDVQEVLDSCMSTRMEVRGRRAPCSEST